MTRSTSRVSLFASQSATTGMPTFNASRNACWSAAGSVTRITSGSMRSGTGPLGPGVPGRPSVPLLASRACLELFLDPDQFVQLRDPLPADGAGLDAEAPEGHGEVGDRIVRGLARPVRHHGRVPGGMGQVHGGSRLGERPNLVRLNKDSVGGALLDPAAESLDVRHEDVG